jgi:hypothetical protein
MNRQANSLFELRFRPIGTVGRGMDNDVPNWRGRPAARGGIEVPRAGGCAIYAHVNNLGKTSDSSIFVHT